MVPIKIHEVNTMDSGRYYCDLFDYNKVTWWICDDEKFWDQVDIRKIYNELSHEDIEQHKNIYITKGPDKIVLMLYINGDNIIPRS